MDLVGTHTRIRKVIPPALLRLAERLDGLFCGYTNMIMDSCLSSRVRLGNGLGWVGLKKMWQLTLGLDVAPSHMAGVWFQVTYRPKGQGVVRKTAVQVLPAPRGDRRLAERLDGLFCGYTNMIMDSCLSSHPTTHRCNAHTCRAHSVDEAEAGRRRRTVGTAASKSSRR